MLESQTAGDGRGRGCQRRGCLRVAGVPLTRVGGQAGGLRGSLVLAEPLGTPHASKYILFVVVDVVVSSRRVVCPS